jgi:MFS family permease
MMQDAVHLQGVESKADRQARSKRRQAFWIVAYALSMTIMGNNIPAPLYPLYQQLWHFSTGMLTVVFAVVAVGVFPSLLFLGPLSDVRGRRPVLLLGVALAIAGALIFILALGVGLGTGLLGFYQATVTVVSVICILALLAGIVSAWTPLLTRHP